MRGLRKTLLLFIIGCFSFGWSCSNKKVSIQNNPSFKVTNGSVQRVMPGIREAKPFVEVRFEIEDLSKEIILDSLHLNGKLALEIYTVGSKRTATLIEFDGSLPEKNEARLFYSKGKKQYYMILSEMLVKEDLLMP